MLLTPKLLLGVCIACVSTLAAAVTVNTIYLDDMPDANRRVLILENETNFTQYIQIEISEDQDTGQRLVQLDSDRVVVATPSALTLLPGQKRSVRITPLFERGDKEYQYVVNVKPVISPKEAAQNKIKAVAAYGVRFIYRPSDPKIAFYFQRSEHGLELINSGNTSVLILGAVVCPSQQAKPEYCESLKAGRVNPGSEKLIGDRIGANQNHVIGRYQVAGVVSEKRVDKIK